MSTPDPANGPRESLRYEPRDRADNTDLTVAVDYGSWSSAAAIFANRQVRDIFEPQALDLWGAELAALLGAESGIAEKVCEGLDSAARLDHRSPKLRIPASVGELLDRLGGDPGGLRHRLAATTAIALEQVLAYDEVNGPRLAPTLDDLYTRVFALPALSVQRLHLPALGRRDDIPDTDDLLDVSSVLMVAPKEVRSAHLRDIGDESKYEETDEAFPGSKRALAEPRRRGRLADRSLPFGWRADTDLLVGLSIRDLVKRVEFNALSSANEFELPIRPRLTQFVITFPTTLDPLARKRYRRLAHDALAVAPDIDPTAKPIAITMDWDEGVAAAMYFVLRSLSGFLEQGLDTFRSRAVGLPGRRGGWRTHMLVIDVGGGTTDIALLALDLVDLTAGDPAGPNDPPDLKGRSYTLVPRLLGSTGHPQLGGDLLTLRMFYWLKAAIADRLHADDPDHIPLAPAVLRSYDYRPVPAEVRAALRRLTPTHRTAEVDGPQGWQDAAFLRLWGAVENAKRNGVDSKGIKFRFGATHAADLPSGVAWIDALRAGDISIELSQADFRQLCAPLITGAARLGADLVRRCLGGDTSARLDIVALSGRTTTLPGADDDITEVLAREFERADGPGTVRWNPNGVIVETTHPKQAAAIGAAWVAGVNRFGFANRRAHGGDELTVQAGELRWTLPMSLGPAGAFGTPIPILSVGTRYAMTDPTGYASTIAFTRSAWQPLAASISLHRLLGPLEGARSMVWGHYLFPDSGGRIASRTLWYQAQIDQNLMLRLLICHGTEDGVRPLLHPDLGNHLASVEAMRLAEVEAARHCFEGDRLRGVPRIEVWSTEDPERTRTELFGAATAESVLTAATTTDGAFTGDSRHPGASLGQDAGRIGISAQPLPLAGSGKYTFAVDGVDTGIELHAPTFDPDIEVDGPDWATLDEYGELRIHAGYPVFRFVDSIDAMWHESGTVHLVDTEPEPAEPRPELDPFSGEH
ncbi:acetate and sugar kinases/Hsc70/actin family protein [Nocardia bovistercoris]|uniref:Molecular chaperone n=1 Tax=Nocardia bovistercoris TaxID=2785916 RepID=A0A931IF92_9NOCA|nr:hypothetical protein [Nocardia bovistercoris]MBH0779473.1 hypothetical protein [Nocardia bovistercoris]